MGGPEWACGHARLESLLRPPALSVVDRRVHVRTALLAAESALPPAVIGLVGFGALVVLLVVAFAFRHVGHRHAGEQIGEKE